MKQRTTTRQPAAPREVYASPCRRVVVIRHGNCDFETRCDGVTLCFCKRQHEAEFAGALWLNDQAETLQPATRGHVAIALTRLVEHVIPITIGSTAELVEHLDGAPDDWTAQPWRALLVDGRHYDLILSKHVIGRPEAQAALDAALAAVRQGIAELAAPTMRKAA